MFTKNPIENGGFTNYLKTNNEAKRIFPFFENYFFPKSRRKMVFCHFLQKNAPLLSTFWVPRGTGREEWCNDAHGEENLLS